MPEHVSLRSGDDPGRETETMKKMTGNDVRALREGLDMTTVQFGKLLGLGPSAVTRWESKKSKAVHMDPFAERVADIIVAQSRKLGKSKFGAIVNEALAHEHDLFALWQILTLAFGETVRIVKKVTSGGKAKRNAKPTKVRAGKRAKRDSRKAEARARSRRAAPRRRAARTKRAAKVAAPSKAKRAPRVRPAAEERVEATPGTNGVTPQ